MMAVNGDNDEGKSDKKELTGTSAALTALPTNAQVAVCDNGLG